MAYTGSMKHRIQWKPLLICLAIPLAAGGLAALLTSRAMAAYAALRQPPLSPPAWVFPVVWTVLYLLMGLVCYRIRGDRTSLRLYAVQLALNFLWPLLYFGAGARLLAFIELLLLWALVVWLLLRCLDRDRTAALLLAPYVLWLSFAAYLNLGTLLLNL